MLLSNHCVLNPHYFLSPLSLEKVKMAFTEKISHFTFYSCGVKIGMTYDNRRTHAEHDNHHRRVALFVQS
jgi:hypothetical protein